MSEVPRVRLFHECYSEPDRLETVQQNLLAQVRAAGLREADVGWCVSQMGLRGSFLCFICVAAVVDAAQPPDLGTLHDGPPLTLPPEFGELKD